MYRSAKPDRFEFVLWTLLAVVMLVGLALPGRVLPAVVLVAVASAFAQSLVRSGRSLPERVATHFNFSRQADGWMSRRWYLVLVAGVAVVVGGLVPLGLFVLGLLAGDAKIERLALWIACLVVGLLLGTHELTVRANMCE